MLQWIIRRILVWSRKGVPEPSLRGVGGGINEEWLRWYSYTRVYPRPHAVAAAQALLVDSGEPWFHDFAEWLNWVQTNWPDTTMGELEALTLDIKERQTYVESVKEPKLYNNKQLISSRWVDWFACKYGCSIQKAELEGIKKMVHKGVFVQGLNAIV